MIAPAIAWRPRKPRPAPRRRAARLRPSRRQQVFARQLLERSAPPIDAARVARSEIQAPTRGADRTRPDAHLAATESRASADARATKSDIPTAPQCVRLWRRAPRELNSAAAVRCRTSGPR